MEDSRFELAEIDKIQKIRLFEREKEKEGLYAVRWDASSKEQDVLFQRTVRKLFNKDYESDVVLRIGENRYNVHSLVLAQSPMMMKKIEAQWGGKVKNEKVVEIDLTKEVKYPQHFTLLLKYLYNGKLDFPEKGKEVSFYQTAKLLEMKDIIDLTLAYMATYFTSVDASRLMGYAKKEDYKHLYEVCMKLMAVKMDKILSSDLVLQFSKENMIGIVQNNNIGLEEYAIFLAVKKWCENYAKKNNVKFITVFKEFENFIRWPLISPHDMITNIVPLKIVERKHIFEHYKYNALVSCPELQLKFFANNPRTVERVGMGFQFKWETKGTMPSYLTRNAKNTILKNSGNSQSSSWWGDKKIDKKGVYFFEYRIIDTPSYSNLMLGIGDKTAITTTQWIGNSPRGWAVYFSGGNKYHSSSSQTYMNNPKPKKGDLFGVILDFRNLKAGKIFFQLNGKAYPLAFSDVTPPVWPAVTLYSLNDEVEIVSNPKIDKGWKKL